MENFMNYQNNYKELYKKIKENVKWKTYSALIQRSKISEGFNKPSRRFIGSEFSSKILEKCSENKIKYVDEPLCDFYYGVDSIEDKTSKNLLINKPTPKKPNKPGSTKKVIKIMLTNIHSTNKNIDEYIEDFMCLDMLLLRQHSSHCIVVASVDPSTLLNNNFKRSKDQITLKFPATKVDFIFREDIMPSIDTTNSLCYNSSAEDAFEGFVSEYIDNQIREIQNDKDSFLQRKQEETPATDQRTFNWNQVL